MLTFLLTLVARHKNSTCTSTSATDVTQYSIRLLALDIWRGCHSCPSNGGVGDDSLKGHHQGSVVKTSYLGDNWGPASPVCFDFLTHLCADVCLRCTWRCLARCSSISGDIDTWFNPKCGLRKRDIWSLESLFTRASIEGSGSQSLSHHRAHKTQQRLRSHDI